MQGSVQGGGGIKQTEADRNDLYSFTSIEYSDECPCRRLMNIAREFGNRYKTIENDESDFEIAWGDPHQAWAEEIKYVRGMDLYEKVPTAHCCAKAGKAPISIKWIDINKAQF